jgi:hypothetical protein
VSEVQHFMAANGVWPTDGALAVVHRYLMRHRRRRYQGGMVGLLAYIVIVIVRPGPWSIDIGFRRFPDLLSALLGGVLAGVVSAELYHLRRRPVPGGVASLEPRPTERYVDGGIRTALRLAAGVSLAVSVVSVFGADRRGLLPGLASLVVVLVVELLQRFIAERPRPALPDDLRRADDAIRRASSAVALPHAGLGLVLLLLGFQVAPALGSTLVAVIAALALLIGAIVQWRRSRVWVVRPQPGVGFEQPAVQP